ncbi:MAG TPA: hypothetical protein V6D17_14385 [Candidatus Obscuribacterales bacterium]
MMWLLEGKPGTKAHAQQGHKKDHWWRVMCLTGVDYFSSMGFQPGLSFLAAGILSPLATLDLVLLTLLGALPAYWIIAKESPHGRGSFSIFERLLPGWKGKTLVLILLGFAATDFIFTITMCAADATAHIVENPWFHRFAYDKLFVTSGLILTLGLVFIKGFQEAIRISFWLVVLYLAVNFYSLYVCASKIAEHSSFVSDWISKLHMQYSSVGAMVASSVVAFPQLALGLSGFETGVAVMPLIKTDPDNDLDQRVRFARYLLVTVALIMGVFLLCGSLVTTLLIPAPLFAEGGEANGRALAYLTHLYLGQEIGTLYDLATVAILWFAGASGMAALLSLVPQYLPRYGMAPDWAAARRPLVIIVTGVALLITLIFKADVDAQAGAFATGLLVLITSGSVAVMLTVWKSGWRRRIPTMLISASFLYASAAIIYKRPDGLIISLLFIAAVIFTSLLSRALRSTELRIEQVQFDKRALNYIAEAKRKHWGVIRILAHRPDDRNYADKVKRARRDHSIQHREGDFIILEVMPKDVSDFIDTTLEVTGHSENDFHILRCSSPSVPNAIAAILLHIRDLTDTIPHAYFEWTEGHPLAYILKYILLGEGETAPLTREILRGAEKDPDRRPKVHAG